MTAHFAKTKWKFPTKQQIDIFLVSHLELISRHEIMISYEMTWLNHLKKNPNEIRVMMILSFFETGQAVKICGQGGGENRNLLLGANWYL